MRPKRMGIGWCQIRALLWFFQNFSTVSLKFFTNCGRHMRTSIVVQHLNVLICLIVLAANGTLQFSQHCIVKCRIYSSPKEQELRQYHAFHVSENNGHQIWVEGVTINFFREWDDDVSTSRSQILTPVSRVTAWFHLLWQYSPKNQFFPLCTAANVQTESHSGSSVLFRQLFCYPARKNFPVP